LNLIETLQNDDSAVSFYQDMESIYDNRFFRKNMSINDLVALAGSGTQLNLFDDVGDKCVCNFK
jgi:hypothetical protein